MKIVKKMQGFKTQCMGHDEGKNEQICFKQCRNQGLKVLCIFS